MIERGLALELWRLTCDFNQYFLFTNKYIYLEIVTTQVFWKEQLDTSTGFVMYSAQPPDPIAQ